AQWLATRRREDVDETAAHRKLPPLVGAFDAFVAGEGERLRQRLERELGTERDVNRFGPRARRRQGLGDRGGGGADEPSAREDVQRAGTLADEVRRRLEAGAPVHAAARQQRDELVAQEPGGPLRGVARVCVLRREQ